MKSNYKGYEIDVHRDQALGGWSNIYFSIFRISDQFEVLSGYCNGDCNTVHSINKNMKEIIDDPYQMEDLLDENLF